MVCTRLHLLRYFAVFSRIGSRGHVIGCVTSWGSEALCFRGSAAVASAHADCRERSDSCRGLSCVRAIRSAGINWVREMVRVKRRGSILDWGEGDEKLGKRD